jgi:hypothetical protein
LRNPNEERVNTGREIRRECFDEMRASEIIDLHRNPTDKLTKK